MRSNEDETMTAPEFAAWCRDNCSHPAQGVKDRPCGAQDELDGVPVFRFCGWHWAAVL